VKKLAFSAQEHCDEQPDCLLLGVLLSLVKASTRLERVQAAFLEQLAVSLHCADALDLLAPLCLRLITKERLGTMEVRRLFFYVTYPYLQCCGSGSALIWLSWIRIMEQGNLPR